MEKVKVLHIGRKGNMEHYSAADSLLYKTEYVDMPNGLTEEEYIAAAPDAQFLIVDAIADINEKLIGRFPDLKLIHSEGAAYNRIDTEAAARKNAAVCCCAGLNAAAVAEQTLLLMTGCLRDVINNDRNVRNAYQIEIKEGYMSSGTLKELSDCSVGLVGFGHIAKAVAKLLKAYGVETIYYNKRTRLSEEEELKFGVKFAGLDELLENSDIVSLHTPVTSQTERMADDAFFSKMKDGSYFINTSRGELVNDEALIRALKSGKLCMAGLDTISNEPVRPDHPLINADEETAKKIVFSPHIGGITASGFRRCYAQIWENVQRAINGGELINCVNRR